MQKNVLTTHSPDQLNDVPQPQAESPTLSSKPTEDELALMVWADDGGFIPSEYVSELGE